MKLQELSKQGEDDGSAEVYASFKQDEDLSEATHIASAAAEISGEGEIIKEEPPLEDCPGPHSPARSWGRKRKRTAVIGGAIFLCSNATERQCFEHHVFGLPETNKYFVQIVKKRMKLFLYNVDQKLLYGVFMAASDGGMNLIPQAFGHQRRFPAQVLFEVHEACAPLQENAFRPAIEENYVSDHKFLNGLSFEQVSRLEQMFRPRFREDIVRRQRRQMRTAAQQEGLGELHGSERQSALPRRPRRRALQQAPIPAIHTPSDEYFARENLCYPLAPQRRPLAPEPLRELYSAPDARSLLASAYEDRFYLGPREPQGEMDEYLRRRREIEESERLRREFPNSGPSLLRHDPFYERYAAARRSLVPGIGDLYFREFNS
ncbi:hypothetical protein L7F22_054267 [Adiantum nelumboides]|nr:hypothetical protein [Adiantum nelumboides]